MENSQLTEALRTLSKNEFREFGKYLSSPFFNNRDELCRLYNYLKKFFPDLRSKELLKENVFRNVYPGKKYSDVTMRKLISLMLNQFTDFLTALNFKNSKMESEVRLLEILRERQLLGLFDKWEKKVSENIKNSKHDFGLYDQMYKVSATLNGVKMIKNEKEMLQVFQKEHDDFTAYSISFLLLQYIRLSEWGRVYNVRYNIHLYNEIVNYLEKNKFTDYPIIPLYYNMLMLITTGNEKYFIELNEYRSKFSSKVSDNNNYNITLVLIQHCYKKIQEGFKEYIQHKFDLTNFLIENNLIPQGFIEQYFFTNTIRFISKIKEFDWCENFINKFRDRLDPQIKDEILNYSFSMIEFHKGNFENSLKYLSAINIDRANMKYDIKNIQAMNMYELGYTEELLSHIDAYKHFINRDEKRTEDFKEKNRKFLGCILSLLKLKSTFNKNEAGFFIQQTQNCDYFSNKDWVLEKIKNI